MHHTIRFEFFFISNLLHLSVTTNLKKKKQSLEERKKELCTQIYSYASGPFTLALVILHCTQRHGFKIWTKETKIIECIKQKQKQHNKNNNILYYC